MPFLFRVLITTFAVFITAHLLGGVEVEPFTTAIVVAFVLSLLNALLKPLLIILTIPVTVMSFGLFLLVINAFIVQITAHIVPGFTVDSFWWALFFSIILSLVTWVLEWPVRKPGRPRGQGRIYFWLFFMLAGLPGVLWAGSAGQQREAVRVETRLAEAVIFPRSAMLTRHAELNLPGGSSRLILTSLPYPLDESQLQIEAGTELRILSVSQQIDYLGSQEQRRHVRELEDSLRWYLSEQTRLQAMLGVYEEERALLRDFRSKGSGEGGISAAELQLAADFFRQRLGAISSLEIENRETQRSHRERADRIRRQLEQIRGIEGQARNTELHLEVYSPGPLRESLRIHYPIEQAGWEPVYDLRAMPEKGQLLVGLKASAWQGSGEDWKDVSLRFSTSRPARSGWLPGLEPWRLRYQADERNQAYMARGVFLMDDAESLVMPMAMEKAGEMPSVSWHEGLSGVEYRLPGHFSLASGGKREIIPLKDREADALFSYYAVPKLSSEVYLLARLAEWSQLFELPGEAGLFLDGRYTGKTRINPGLAADTLELSLGTDGRVAISRERIQEESRRSLFGGRVTETVGWQLSVRNNRSIPLSIRLMDQFPLATSSDMEVSVSAPGAEINQEKGLLTWRVELNAGDTWQGRFSYEVKYPSGKRLILE